MPSPPPVRRPWLTAALAACGLAASLPLAVAGAAQLPAAKLEPALRPATPNRPTTVAFKVRFGGSAGLPPPLRFARVFLPEGLTNLKLSWPRTLGCSRSRLLARGPAGCPPRSQIGYGSALLALEAGGVIERKRARLTVFVGPTNGAYILNVLGEVAGPLAIRFVFSEQLSAVSSPYSSGVEVALGNSFVSSLLELTEVVGAPVPRGAGRRFGRLRIYTPRRCPAGGYHWFAAFQYAGGASQTVETVTPCP